VDLEEFNSVLPSIAMAADNQGTGDVAGVDGDLTDSNVFTLNALTLALIKRAYLADGTPLAHNDSVPRGTVVKFMIFVNNDTPIPVTDITIQDQLDGAFVYSSPSIKVDNTFTCATDPCTGPEELLIFAAIDDNAALLDSPGDDVASYDGTDTIDVGNGNEGTNAQADVADNSVYAVLMTVTVQ
jgi:uncharacterized repeat protein (TIGR01451 family)